MYIEISMGEAIDKLSILEIKTQFISDSNKLAEIRKEIQVLQECRPLIEKYKFLYSLLVHYNKEIWQVTDLVKKMNPKDEDFAVISNKAFEFNTKRFRIKKLFNELNRSNLKEQKSFSETNCKIVIKNKEILFDKIPEINYLSLEYDYINLVCPDNSLSKITQTIFNTPNFCYNSETETDIIIKLEDYSISDDLQKIFAFPVLSYAAGGKLGDFVHYLSIMNENFLKTGRKAAIYLIDTPEAKFLLGLERTLQDTKSFVNKQKYVESFQIHKGEPIDVNLYNWRSSNLLYKTNWHFIFKDFYQVDWGVNKWLTFSETLPELLGKVLISQTSVRINNNINYNSLLTGYDLNEVYFLTQNNEEYQKFLQSSNLHIKCYLVETLEKMIIAINSCELFIGNLSSPLAIAYALHKRNYTILCNGPDDIHISGLNNIMPCIEKIVS